MAHFIGRLQGSRGSASRLGTKASGIKVQANGWETGCIASIAHEDGVDVVTVWLTGGSNNRLRHKLLGSWHVVDNDYEEMPR